MLHIVLTILKILGIILLSILTLLLVLVLCILFLPLRYRAHLVYHGRWDLQVKVSYLFGNLILQYKNNKEFFGRFNIGIIRMITFQYKISEENSKKLKIFGIDTHWFDEKEASGNKKNKRLNFGKKAKKKDTSKKMTKQEVVEEITTDEIMSDEILSDSIVTDEIDKSTEEIVTENVSTEEYKKEQSKKRRSFSLENFKLKNFKLKKKLIRLRQKIKAIPRKIRYIFQRICDTIRKVKRKMIAIYEFLKDEALWQAVKMVKQEFRKLLGHVRPRTIKGYVHFGFANPATTGTVCGMIYSFYGVLPKKLKVTTDFEQRTLDGDILIKGRIYVYYVLLRVLKICKDPNIKKILGKRRNHGREE